MKKIMKNALIASALLLIWAIPVFAQTGESGNELSLFISESTYYRVYSELSSEHAEATAKKLDAFFTLFNSFFRFDPGQLQSKLNVRIFSTRQRFNNYLKSIIDQEQNNFVFLQYSDPKKSELVGFKQTPNDFDTSLLRQGFIQYFKSFIQYPPDWMLKGFAVYFEKSQYDQDHQYAVFKENLSWLPTLKEAIRKEASVGSVDGQGLISPTQFLNPSDSILSERREVFHAQAWGFIKFLHDSEQKKYNRLLWDSISALQKSATKVENVKAINQKAFNWANRFLLINDFKEFILSLKTFPELVQEGINLYAGGNYDEAEEVLLEAILIDGSHYLPYYYLGLIHYAQKDYSLAEYYYQSALMLGGDNALIQYALGVNSFANSRYEEAENYLLEAKRLNEEKYGEKVSNLLERIDEAYEEEGTQGM